MYLPEYTITSKTMKNVGAIEYAKAVLENTSVLPRWEKQLKKDADIRTINSVMRSLNLTPNPEIIKKLVDEIGQTSSTEMKNIKSTLEQVEEISENRELEETELKYVHKSLGQGILPKSKTGTYRNTKLPKRVLPEEILANMVQVFDWHNSLDAKETHPIIKAGILKAYLELIEPFDSFNSATINLIIRISMSADNYNLKNYTSIENYYDRTRKSYEHFIDSLDIQEPDMTAWLEYFTDGIALEATALKDKILLLAKDTKIAKATGRVRLTPRQERIIEYLQDYGILQNQNFTTVFPNISEDTVLRDLKTLIDKGLIVKRGSTKSSHYELK